MSRVHGEITDAVVDIWKKWGLPFVLKWVDNRANSRELCPNSHVVLWYPQGLLRPDSESSNFVKIHYNYDKLTMLAMINDLRVPWHLTKGQDFYFVVKYVGFPFNFLQ
jgi:hypothetical protein